jgi:hypothetical protein
LGLVVDLHYVLKIVSIQHIIDYELASGIRLVMSFPVSAPPCYQIGLSAS